MTQYAIGEDEFPEFADHWRCYLRSLSGETWQRALEEAKRRKNYHEKRNTPQTSNRDKLPRSVLEEWMHLKGEAALTLMLQARGYPISLEDLNWGSTSLEARERSRRGNVLPGISVYVPREAGEGLIVRGPERLEYPDLRYVLVWERRSGRPDEYLVARGHLLAWQAHARGSNFGPRGTPLRHKDDRLVAPSRLEEMDNLIGLLG